MILDRITAGIYATNCYVIGCENTRQGIVVDPGGDADRIMQAVEKNGLDIKYIILTHGHFDHIGALKELKDRTKAKVAIHSGDAHMLEDPGKSLAALVGSSSGTVSPDVLLKDGELLKAGDLEMEIIHTPGHTPGGICIKIGDGVLLSGDTLFAGSVGRTDLPGGDFDSLMHSIKTRLAVLPGDTKVYPGHGVATTIEREKEKNPFLTGDYL
ncbi:MAG: MBL fold metallo-hydrolase [Clostridiales bacterium]|nr:MBL fold metallo-hydrolase [Clostridiales bacterium]HOC08136.1 MBL fold metallo-hydrolase [Bacillota bacterium]HQD41904.1 MBL fold metallo-hydrolase [Bacillota bacterium]